jgi:hypothetical protein
MTHLEQTYKQHGIYDVPDPALHEPIPVPITDMARFEDDIEEALILDSKRSSPPARPQPIARTPSGRPCTPGCVCSTPLLHDSVLSVVYQNESHLACWSCGRIIDIDHDAFDERIRNRIDKKLGNLQREFSVSEESFMVDQIRAPIIRSFAVPSHYFGHHR